MKELPESLKWRELYALESSITLGDDVNATTINAYRCEKYLPGPAISFIEKAALEEKDRVIRELEKEQAEHIEILAAEYDRKFKEKEAVIQELVARLRDARQWVAIQAAISESKTIKDDLILIEQVIEKHSKGASDCDR